MSRIKNGFILKEINGNKFDEKNDEFHLVLCPTRGIELV